MSHRWDYPDVPLWSYDPVLFPGGDTLDLLWSFIHECSSPVTRKLAIVRRNKVDWRQFDPRGWNGIAWDLIGGASGGGADLPLGVFVQPDAPDAPSGASGLVAVVCT